MGHLRSQAVCTLGAICRRDTVACRCCCSFAFKNQNHRKRAGNGFAGCRPRLQIEVLLLCSINTIEDLSNTANGANSTFPAGYQRQLADKKVDDAEETLTLLLELFLVKHLYCDRAVGQHGATEAEEEAVRQLGIHELAKWSCKHTRQTPRPSTATMSCGPTRLSWSARRPP